MKPELLHVAMGPLTLELEFVSGGFGNVNSSVTLARNWILAFIVVVEFSSLKVQACVFRSQWRVDRPESVSLGVLDGQTYTGGTVNVAIPDDGIKGFKSSIVCSGWNHQTTFLNQFGPFQFADELLRWP